MRWIPKMFRGLFGDQKDPMLEMAKSRAEAIESMLARQRAERREAKLRADIRHLQTIAQARRGT